MTLSPLRRLALGTLAVLAVLGTAVDAVAGSIVARTFESPTLGRAWSYNVYLPTGYEQSGGRYPVLYLLHGNGQRFTSWAERGDIQATADALIASGEIPAALIVMPDAGTTWYVDRKEPMETAFLRDLIPDVEATYRALSGRDDRVIAGLSMGGYGSVRFVLQHPDMFAAAGLLSPAIYDPVPPENSSARRVNVFGSPQFDASVWQAYSYPALWEAYLATGLPVPMYIVSGDDDEFQVEASALQFYELLRRHAQPAELRIVDGGHTWDVWRTTVGDAMKYVFRYVSHPVPRD